tara:strand:+ start:1818 stop:2972 length:1155 start_codon:yes stop_codon:yes gene_type:complete
MVSENRSASRIVRSTYDEDTVREAAEQCRNEIGDRPSVVFAFISSDWRKHFQDFVEVVQVYGHAAEIVGCTADGFIGTQEEDENVSGCCLVFLHFPNTNVQFLELSPDDIEDFDSGGIEPGGFWISLCNPFLAHAEQWMTRWNAIFDQTPTFGGLASGGGDPEDVFLFHNRDAASAACIGVRFEGGIQIRGVVSQGCRPIGSPYTITEVDENVIVSIASRRAFDVLEEAFESLSSEDKEVAKGNIFAGLAVSEYLEEFSRGDFLVRNILGGDPTAGVIMLGAFPRAGQTMQFQIRDKDSADEDLKILCEKTVEKLGVPIAGLLFSCTGRGSRMFGIPNHDADVIADAFGKVPIGGFFCNGEIGPIGDSNFLHGYTASAALFYDA